MDCNFNQFLYKLIFNARVLWLKVCAIAIFDNTMRKAISSNKYTTDRLDCLSITLHLGPVIGPFELLLCVPRCTANLLI